jgi:AraC family transcriptional regulator of arabinose operon
MLSPRRPLITFADDHEVAALFAQVRADFDANRPLCGLLSGGLLHRLIILSWLARDDSGPHAATAPFDLRVAMTRLEEHATEAIDLVAFAREIGMGYSTFRRRFREATGYAPKEYILRCRMRRAKELLALTSLSVAAIAKQTGIADQYYFSRLFRAREGLSPTRFRSQQSL